MRLSVLTVTRGEAYAAPFLRAMATLSHSLGAEFVLALDGSGAVPVQADTVVRVTSNGYVESVLEAGLAACRGEHVLRLDDDERASPAMATWLQSGAWLTPPDRPSVHWQFHRLELWPDAQSAILTPPLFGCCQTRLSVRAKAGGRRRVHGGSPFGGGTVAPVALEHHKFLVKSLADRRALAAWYDCAQPGYGTGPVMLPFNVPEDAFAEVTIGACGDGTIPWQPTWTKQLPMGATR